MKYAQGRLAKKQLHESGIWNTFGRASGDAI